MEMAADKAFKGRVVTDVTTGSVFRYYTSLATKERHNHHEESLKRELILNVVQKLH
jgi:hypothetical protein